jgi:hypothetical protein
MPEKRKEGFQEKQQKRRIFLLSLKIFEMGSGSRTGDHAGLFRTF